MLVYRRVSLANLDPLVNKYGSIFLHMGGGSDFCSANVGITGGYECIVICKPDMSAAVSSNGFHEMVMVCFPMVDINSSVFLTKLSSCLAWRARCSLV